MSRLFLPSLVWILACRAPAAPPNVVVIVIDDLGWADTGVYGSSFYETPNIDRLAATGTRLSQFYTASPVCSPTRASLMTGKHPARLHLTNWIGGEQSGMLLQAPYDRQLPLAETTVGEAFREAGYVTGYVGKWHLGDAAFLPGAQGFDWTFAVNHAGQPGSHFFPYENPDWPVTNVPDLEDGTEGDYLTDRLTNSALEFVEANRASPFLLVLSHYAVHTPLESKAHLTEKYRTKAASLPPATESDYRREREAETRLRQDHPEYAGMIESTDQGVGRILDRLETLQLDDRTIVVFVSDNGGLSTLMRRSFNQATSNLPLRAGKGWLYEGGIRAPLIVRWPGRVPAGAVVDAPATSDDLFPTLLELAGLPLKPTDHADGISLAPTLLDGVPVDRTDLFWHFPHYHGSGNRPSGAVRSGDYKLIEWFETGDVELYDLRGDLGEARDLAADRPALVNTLREKLHAWREEVNARMPQPNPSWGETLVR